MQWKYVVTFENILVTAPVPSFMREDNVSLRRAFIEAPEEKGRIYILKFLENFFLCKKKIVSPKKGCIFPSVFTVNLLLNARGVYSNFEVRKGGGGGGKEAFIVYFKI